MLVLSANNTILVAIAIANIALGGYCLAELQLHIVENMYEGKPPILSRSLNLIFFFCRNSRSAYVCFEVCLDPHTITNQSSA